MPFDNTATTSHSDIGDLSIRDFCDIDTRAELVANVATLVKVFGIAANAADKAADSKAAACDAILATFREALNEYDVTPL